MSRIRSRIVETASVNQRLLRRGAVTRSAIQPREVGALEQLPGLPRPIRPKDLATETVEDLDARFTGRTLTLSRTTSQTITYNAGAGEPVELTTLEGDTAGFEVPSLPAAAPSLPVDGVWGMSVKATLGAVPSGTEVLVVDGSGVRLWPKATTWVAAADLASPVSLDVVVPHRPWNAGTTPKLVIVPPTGETVDVTDVSVTWGIEGPRSAVITGNEWKQVYDGDVWGLTRQGSYWWVTDGVGRTVTRLSSSWETTGRSFTAAGFKNQARGIALVGDDLWLSGDEDAATNEDVVLRYSTDGSGTQLQEISFGTNRGLAGMAFDGTDLFVVESNTDVVWRFPTSGGITDTLNVTGTPQGLDYHAGMLFVADASAGTVQVRDPDVGTLLATLDVSDATSAPTGVYVLDGTLYVSEDGVGVWANSAILSVEGVL